MVKSGPFRRYGAMFKICSLSVCLVLMASVPGLAQPYDLVIQGGRVMDPDSGLDAIRHIGITDGTIQAISEIPLVGETEIDASGLVVAPGFIDANVGNPDRRQVNSVRVLDGVTTALVMESAPSDVDRWYEEQRTTAIINYGTAVGFWQARLDVMGDPSLEGTAQWAKMEHTKAKPEAIKAILKVLEQGLEAGAVGIGIPLEYTPAATHAELLDVFRLADRFGAPAHIHLRSWGYDEKRIRSYGDLYEVISASLVTKAQIHVLHLNSSYNDWTPMGLEMIGKAQNQGLALSTDMYPYAFGGCPSGAAYFDDWETYPEEYFSTSLRLASTGEWLTKAKFRALRESDHEVGLICYDNTEEMVELALKSPLTMIASDGGGTLHPRIAGTYSRILGHYVRQKGVVTLMDALAKMTIMPARHFEAHVPALRLRGRLQVGSIADVVAFDPDRIIDRSTVLDPLKPSLGMQYVLVNGVPVVRDGILQTDVLPGQAIRALRHRGSSEHGGE